ncbi:MAG: ABC transporter permease [Microbacteriaceae bacterium]|nr:ABC transporter permease [Burkholderiaceae bacterium]
MTPATTHRPAPVTRTAAAGSWGAFSALVRKDLVLYGGNRRALVMGLGAPILVAAFFGYLFDNKRAAPSRIPVVVTDADGSALSKGLVAALRAEAALSITELPEAEATQAVLQGRQRAAIVLPAGLGNAAPGALFGAHARPEITLRYDPSQAMVLPIVKGLLAQHLMAQVGQATFGGGHPGGGSASAGSPAGGSGDGLAGLRADLQHNPHLPAQRRQDLQALLDSVARLQQVPGATAAAAVGSASSTAAASSASSAATSVDVAAAAEMAASARTSAGLNLPFTTRDIAASGRSGADYNSFAHAFAGMGVQFILFLGIEFGVGLLLMRRQGLWQRLRAAPVSRSLLLGSRIVSAAIIAFGLLMAIFAVAIAVFGVRIQGSVAGFIAIALAFAVLTASFGLLIAALGKTPEASRGLAIFATLLMVMLGGAWVPSFLFPDWLQTVSLAVPTRWAVDGLDAMTWRGLGFEAAVAPTGVMLAFAAVFTALAVWRFDWQES